MLWLAYLKEHNLLPRELNRNLKSITGQPALLRNPSWQKNWGDGLSTLPKSDQNASQQWRVADLWCEVSHFPPGAVARSASVPGKHLTGDKSTILTMQILPTERVLKIPLFTCAKLLLLCRTCCRKYRNEWAFCLLCFTFLRNQPVLTESLKRICHILICANIFKGWLLEHINKAALTSVESQKVSLDWQSMRRIKMKRAQTEFCINISEEKNDFKLTLSSAENPVSLLGSRFIWNHFFQTLGLEFEAPQMKISCTTSWACTHQCDCMWNCTLCTIVTCQCVHSRMHSWLTAVHSRKKKKKM